MRDRGIIDEIKKKLGEATDYLLEQIASIPGTAIWNNMKVRCDNAAVSDGAMALLVDGLTRLKKQHPKLEIHAIGHSAGSIMIGDMLPVLTRKKLRLDTCSLYAPACTVAFARNTYLKAIKTGTLDADNLVINLLSDANESANSVGPYCKSLLYLVGRAFEAHKTPILGMEAVWNAKLDKEGVFNDDKADLDPTVAKWRETTGRRPAGPTLSFCLKKRSQRAPEQVSRRGTAASTIGSTAYPPQSTACATRRLSRPLDKPVGSLEYLT